MPEPIRFASQSGFGSVIWEACSSVIILLWLVFPIACAILASNKGRSAFGWLLLGLLLGPIALILAAVVSNKKTEERELLAARAQGVAEAAKRKCPFCAERIQPDAIVCRYCGREVPPLVVSDQTNEPSRSTPPSIVSNWVARNWVALPFLVVVAIYLVRPYLDLDKWGRHDQSVPQQVTPDPGIPASTSTDERASKPDSQPLLTQDRLSAMSESERGSALSAYLMSIGEQCSKAIKIFYQGTDEQSSAVWDVSCEGGASYAIMVNNDPNGWPHSMNCSYLNTIKGRHCFKKL